MCWLPHWCTIVGLVHEEKLSHGQDRRQVHARMLLIFTRSNRLQGKICTLVAYMHATANFIIGINYYVFKYYICELMYRSQLEWLVWKDIASSFLIEDFLWFCNNLQPKKMHFICLRVQLIFLSLFLFLWNFYYFNVG